MNKDPKVEQTNKIAEYLKTHEEIFNFIIHRKINLYLLQILSIFSVVFALIGFFGVKFYIDYMVNNLVTKTISDKTNEEYSYLSKRNKITELGDMAISTAKTEYYEEIKKYIASKEQQRIYNAAKSELMRVDFFFFVNISDYSLSELEGLVYTTQEGKTIKGFDIPSKGLIEIFYKSKDVREKICTLLMLDSHKEEGVPEFLLEVVRNSNDMRIRHTALRSFQILVGNFPENRFDYKENELLWEKHQKEFYKINEVSPGKNG